MLKFSTIVDVEASALDLGYPIEIGVAQYDKNTDSVIESSKVIRHDPWLKHGLWSKDAERIHGISKEEIYDIGVPLDEVCSWLNETVGPRTVHVGDMRDKMWLSQTFDEADRVPIFQIDYIGEFMRAARIDKNLYNEVLGEMPHRAGGDALQMACAVQHCLRFSQ